MIVTDKHREKIAHSRWEKIQSLNVARESKFSMISNGFRWFSLYYLIRYVIIAVWCKIWLTVAPKSKILFRRTSSQRLQNLTRATSYDIEIIFSRGKSIANLVWPVGALKITWIWQNPLGVQNDQNVCDRRPKHSPAEKSWLFLRKTFLEHQNYFLSRL